MARLTYPRASEPRPEALPPEDRTVGQLVGESLRIYGDRFWPSVLIGLPPAGLAFVTDHVGRRTFFVLAPSLYGALFSAALVGASVIVLRRRRRFSRLAVAWLAGCLIFAPVSFLALLYVLPALAWLGAVGLAVPVLVAEDVPALDSARRAWQLARAGYIHVLGSLATLVIVTFLTERVLAFLLRGAGGAAVDAAFVLANVVISPVFFLGFALLYVDQAARLEVGVE
jgi:hypothetical protein